MRSNLKNIRRIGTNYGVLFFLIFFSSWWHHHFCNPQWLFPKRFSSQPIRWAMTGSRHWPGHWWPTPCSRPSTFPVCAPLQVSHRNFLVTMNRGFQIRFFWPEDSLHRTRTHISGFVCRCTANTTECMRGVLLVLPAPQFRTLFTGCYWSIFVHNCITLIPSGFTNFWKSVFNIA